MAITVTENIFKTKYKDDFADSDGYHRILFNPRRALQARELTQMQTIIQREVERFGRNIFKEGSSVSSSGVIINSNYEFVKISTAFPASDIVGQTFTGQTSNVQIRVLETVAASGSDPNTLYVRYTNSISGTSGTTPIRLTPGEQLSADNISATMTVQTINTTLNPAVGAGVRISTGKGDFFVQGFFVYAPAQDLILSKYSREHTTVIGFKVLQEIITSEDNSALYDNQGDLPNPTAPGADRFRIKLVLSSESDVQPGETFVAIGKVQNSRIIEIANGQSQYNKINDILAQRTKEESGNYITKPFSVSYDSADVGNLTLTVSEGTAYVNGYRVNNPTPSFITVSRSTTSTVPSTDAIGVEYGNYVVATDVKGAPDINNLTKVNISTSATNSGGTIGTCRIRSIEYVSSSTEYRVYIFDVQMIGSNKFRDARSIGTGTANYAVLKTKTNTNGAVVGEIQEANREGLFFSVPNIRPKELTDTRLVYQKKFTGNTNSSGQVSYTGLTGNDKWTDTTSWLVYDDTSGAKISPTSAISGAGTTTATVECGSSFANKSVSIIAYVLRPDATSKTKTATSHSLNNKTLTTDSDGFGNTFKFLDLDATDIIKVTSATLDDANTTDIAHYFELDNGQRDAFYDQGRLILKSNFTDPTADGTTMDVTVSHYTHSTTGDFFSVNSYSGSYSSIPTFTAENGFEINLRDVLDFRPVKDQSGEFTGAGARQIRLPKNTDTITSDISYYQPRNDKIVITETAELKVVEGTASLTPRFPDTPSNSLELFRTKMGANTLSGQDVTYDMVEAKGYTMSELGKIEKRVEKLEELTNLSLLELDTSKFSVQDSNGNERVKSGFIVDNFIDHFYSAVDNSQYAASVDPKDHTLHPSFFENNIGLVFDSANSNNSGIIRKGDNLYLTHTDSSEISQLQASQEMDVNSFDTFQFNGNITLSPASDEWRDADKVGQKSIVGGQKLSFKQDTLWNNWEWNWLGTDVNGNDIAAEEDQSERYIQPDTRSFSDRTGSYLSRGLESVEKTIVNRVVSSETIRKIVDDRVVDVAIIPFMRSRLIHFDAVGLRPNTRVFPYFDNVDVSDWCREDAVEYYAEGLDSDYGNLHGYATSHPEGSTNLVTDAEGKVSGTFYVPNTPQIHFRSGVREFKLLDITTSTEANASTKASALYNAAGVVEKNHNGIVSTRHITINGSDKNILADRVIGSTDTRGRIDPLAQTFFVENEEGMFASSIDLFFSDKDADLPVWIQIVPIVNGSPSREVIVPGSIKYLSPASINVSKNAQSATTFEFNEPVFLKGFTEYAITIQSDSKAYKLWAGNAGDLKVGTTQEKVTKQTNVGPLFTPQNSFKWEPQFNIDIKFNLRRCKFNVGQNNKAYLHNRSLPAKLLGTNPISTTGTGTNAEKQRVVVTHPNSGLVSGDVITLTGVGSVGGLSLDGDHTITLVDGEGFAFNASVPATASALGGGIDVTCTQNYQYNILNPYIETLVPESTDLSARAKQTSGKSLAGVETPYQKETTFTDIALKKDNYTTSPKLIPHDGKATKGTEIELTMGTTNNYVSPVVDLQRASLIAIGNRIDRQVQSGATAGFNEPIKYVDETDKTEGSHLSKHVTKPIPLVVDAVGLKIILSANRPIDSEFELYFKTVSEDQTLSTIQWTKVEQENPVPADENRSAFREYRYLVGGQNGTMTPFTAFQLKIVFKSKNSSKVPIIKDLRAIALGV